MRAGKDTEESIQWQLRTEVFVINFFPILSLILVISGAAFGFGEDFGWFILSILLVSFGAVNATMWLWWEYLRHIAPDSLQGGR